MVDVLGDIIYKHGWSIDRKPGMAAHQKPRSAGVGTLIRIG
jgi:hypothetical protein